MIVDPSAVIAILFDEIDAPRFASAIEQAAQPAMSTVSRLEATIVMLSRKGPGGVDRLNELLTRSRMEFAPFDNEQCEIACRAFARYGKGRHPAGLNFGDCAAYALAMSRALPLLYKGNDFSHTDVLVARV